MPVVCERCDQSDEDDLIISPCACNGQRRDIHILCLYVLRRRGMTCAICHHGGMINTLHVAAVTPPQPKQTLPEIVFKCVLLGICFAVAMYPEQVHPVLTHLKLLTQGFTVRSGVLIEEVVITVF